MVKKFCRIIENEKGEQLLIHLSVSDHGSNFADVHLRFALDEDTVSGVTLGGIEWDAAHNYIENYPEEDGLHILESPIGFVTEIMSNDKPFDC